MSKLSLDAREEFRAFVEEQLKTVPEGKRMKLSKETLEKLLFEEVVINEEKNIIVKFPVWSGEFLRKLDLNQVDFENVTWHSLYNLKDSSGLKSEEQFINEFLGLYDDKFKKRIEPLLNLKRLYNKNVNYSWTNASIDLSKSFENVFFGDWIYGCDFSGCNIYFSKEITGLELYDCNFSNSSLKLIGTYGRENLMKCNFENCDLSQCENDILFSIIVNGKSNFRNTKAKLIYDKSLLDEENKKIDINTQRLIKEFLNNELDKYVVGAYLNGEFILPLEERKKVEFQKLKEKEASEQELQRLQEEESKQELQRLKDEVSELFKEQQEEDKSKRI